MGNSDVHTPPRLPATPWGFLPAELRVLHVTGPKRTGRWLADALASDAACRVIVETVSSMPDGLARLRDASFDALLIGHEPGELDALEMVDAVHAGGGDEQAIIVLGDRPEQEMEPLCHEAGGDAYLCVPTSTTRGLIWKLARAVEHRRLVAENRRLQQAQRHRLQREHDEASRLLRQQRSMIADLERLSQTSEDDDTSDELSDRQLPAIPCPDLPAELVAHYRELLRAYVIMGSGNLAEELRRFASSLVGTVSSAEQAMLLHLHVLEQLVEGLGSRSARHVLTRADMLVLEVMLNLAEGYRTRYQQLADPPRQQLLPGFAA